jgi:four helix bundle protein
MERDMSETKSQQMPIFSKTYDLLVWLLQATRHFPKMHRHDFTKRLLDAAFDLRERLEEANFRRSTARLKSLELADEALAKLRLYIRLAAKMEWLSKKQYVHVVPMLSEIGKLLGGWLKAA